MKGICKYIPFAIAAFVSLHSCSREAVPEAPEAARTVSVGFSFGADTKAAEMPAADFEDVLYSTDIFFFDAETGKRLYSQHNSTAPLKVLSGHYHVYALANLDKDAGSVYSTIDEESDLTEVKVSFGTTASPNLTSGWRLADVDDHSFAGLDFLNRDTDYSAFIPYRFSMSTDMMDITITEDQTITFDLKRHAARIAVTKKIDYSVFKQRFIDPVGDPDLQLYAPTFKDDGYAALFLVNVPRSMDLIGSARPTASGSAADTFNPYGTSNPNAASSGLSSTLNYIGYAQEGIASTGQNGGTYLDVPYILYCFPNTAARRTEEALAADPHVRDFTTKAVIALAEVSGPDIMDLVRWHFYPIAIPNIERNKTYIIRSVKIYGPGALNPWEDPPGLPETGAISYSIQVTDWTAGDISKIYSGGKDTINGSGDITM